MMNAEVYRQMNRERGQPYCHWPAHRCYCWNPRTGEYDRDCPECEGGFIYGEQAADESYRCLIWESEIEFNDADYGPQPVGTWMISVMPDESPLARYDKIALPLSPLDERIVLQRGVDEDGQTSDSLLDTLPFTEVLKIQDVRRGMISYREGIDYTLSGNSIEWLEDGLRPDDELTYSLRVFYVPRFIFLGVFKPAQPTDLSQPVAGSLPTGLLPLHGALYLLKGDEE